VPMLDAYAGFILTDAMGPRTFLDAPVGGESGTLLFRTFSTLNGRVVGVASQDRQYEALCRALDREDLLGDTRFASIGARFANLPSFYALIEGELEKWSTDKFIERARRFGAPFAPVLDVEGFLDDAQVRHNQTVITRSVSGAGEARFLRPPLRFERTPAQIGKSPPRLGEHSDEILAELGYDSEKRAGLFDRAVTK